MIVVFFILVAVFSLIIFLIFMVWGFLSVGPWVGTTRENLELLFETLGKVRGRKLLDVGSGDGRVVFEAARRSFDATGVEINPSLYLISLAKAFMLKADGKAHFVRDNLWHCSFTPYDVIVCFVFPKSKSEIEEKFKKEGKAGAKLIFLKQQKGLEVIAHE